MLKKILTRNGLLEFKEIKLQVGRKKIDKIEAKKNLLDAAMILNKIDVEWGLIFGTLLGAVREADFIAHDEDTDIYVLNESKEALIDALNDFINIGFSIARYEDTLLSIIRNDEYIDFYFMKRTILGNRRSGQYLVPKRFWAGSDFVDLFDHKFPTLSKHQEYLEFVYGQNWRVPIANANAKGDNSFFYRLFKLLGRFCKF